MWNSKDLIVSSENSPETLLVTCLRKIVTDSIDFKHVSLPQEICNLMLQIFREQNANKSSEDFDPKTCEKFLNQFSSKNTRLSLIDLSELPVTDVALRNILREHSKNMIYLNIGNCTQLTEEARSFINTITTQVDDFSKICRTAIITERNQKIGEKRIIEKSYKEGVLRTVKDGDEANCAIEHVTPRDDISLYKAMGILDDPCFSEFKGQKLFQWSHFKGEGFLNSSERMAASVTDVLDAAEIVTPSLSESSHSPFNSSSSTRYNPKLLYPAEESVSGTCDDTLKEASIKTWQSSPLKILVIGRSTQILPDYFEEETVAEDFKLFNPNLALEKLVIHEWNTMDNTPVLNFIITPPLTSSLRHLDLSNCSSIGNGSALLQLKQLRSLILYNCPKLHSAIINISKLTGLRYLDISTSNDRYGHSYKHPESQLEVIALGLINLTHLDISGTNLAGPRCDHIQGLASRYTKPFEFLGLYNTANEAAYRSNIPALKVAGDATEEQILNACEAYIDRVDCLKKTLNDLFHCFRFETNFHDINRALDVVLMSMACHLQEKQIQIAASASLFYIVKSDEAKHNFNIKIKRLIIERLLDAMQAHRFDTTMLRNGSLTLIHFKIPQDVLFEYKRLVDILLHIVTNDEDDFIQRLGIYLLNSLACQVDGDQKMLVGDLGAIQKMLSLIEAKLQRGVCDEVMETAWSTMWNVTDETPVNCERFLENKGMDYFVKCMTAFSNSAELLRNMMGLLGNVAECQHLRSRLMKAEYIGRFCELLNSDRDGIEVSYNAAGILSHIISDGDTFWETHLTEIRRDYVMANMNQVISKWKINSKRNINYRSFEPILRLLHPDIVEITSSHYWAVFALANLTRVYSSKYCLLLREEGGIVILEHLLRRPKVPDHIAKLIRVTLKQVQLYESKEEEQLKLLEESDRIEEVDNLGGGEDEVMEDESVEYMIP